LPPTSTLFPYTTLFRSVPTGFHSHRRSITPALRADGAVQGSALGRDRAPAHRPPSRGGPAPDRVLLDPSDVRIAAPGRVFLRLPGPRQSAAELPRRVDRRVVSAT